MTAKTPQEDIRKMREALLANVDRSVVKGAEIVLEQLIEAEATRRELALLDELEKVVMEDGLSTLVKTIAAKRQALKKGAE